MNDEFQNSLSMYRYDSGLLFLDHSEQIRNEQIRILFQLSKTAFLATPMLAAVLVWVHWNIIPQLWLLIWFAAICLLTLIRYLHVRAYFTRDTMLRNAVKAARIFLLGTLLAGVFWGVAGGAFYINDSPVHKLFLAFLLGGIVAGSMTTLSAYKGAFLTFSVPAVLPYTYQAMIHSSETNTAMAAACLLFLVLMIKISFQNYRNVMNTLRLRFNNSDLIRHLRAAKDRQLATNCELQAQIEKKNQAEQALQITNNILEQRILERTEALIQVNEKLEQEKELFKVTLASIGDGVVTTDFYGRVTYLNPVAELLTGKKSNEVEGALLHEAFHFTDTAVHECITQVVANQSQKQTDNYFKNQECLLIREDNKQFAISYTLAPIHDGKNNIIGTVSTFRDVTEERDLTQKLAYQATHDALTNLLNRHEFESRLAQILEATRDYQTHALLYLDLDQFKVVNDTCGHNAGDELLRQISALLQTRLRSGDTCARLGGDEFGIILEHCPYRKVLHIAQTLRELVQNFRFHWQDKTFTIGVSIGVFPINQTNITLVKALSAADSACYVAKDSGRNRIHVYQEADSILLKRSGEMQWLPRIQQAIEDGRFLLYFQPIVMISRHKEPEKHGEILLRLQDEQGNLISPGAFLPSAERYNQMLTLDRWVVERTFKLLRAASLEQSQTVYAINLSAQSLGDEDFLDFVVNGIKKNCVCPSYICFEITENVALADLRHVTQFIMTLKKLGCRFSMDDFGSGLSSFGYLKDLQLDYLKIDGKLVKDMLDDPIDHAMVEAIHKIGHVMQLKTIAEWVENNETQGLLEQMGVDFVQGFWPAEPYLIDDQPINKISPRQNQ